MVSLHTNPNIGQVADTSLGLNSIEEGFQSLTNQIEREILTSIEEVLESELTKAVESEALQALEDDEEQIHEGKLGDKLAAEKIAEKLQLYGLHPYTNERLVTEIRQTSWNRRVMDISSRGLRRSGTRGENPLWVEGEETIELAEETFTGSTTEGMSDPGIQQTIFDEREYDRTLLDALR